jgi:nitroreductase
VEYQDFLELIRTRRTIRAIKPDPVPDGTVDKLLEAARWAPSGFNMQPVEYLVVEDAGLRAEVRRVVDDYKNRTFFALEATREPWQGAVWSAETHGSWVTPDAPVMIAVLGDTRRRVGLPMAARHATQKGDSIFEASLAGGFLYLLLAAQTLGLAAMPCSAVKYPSMQGLLKHLLNLPDFIYLYDMVLAGRPAQGGEAAPKLTRGLDELVHRDRAADDEFPDEEELRRQIVQLRGGSVDRHEVDAADI